jgi:hypothetical protein
MASRGLTAILLANDLPSSAMGKQSGTLARETTTAHLELGDRSHPITGRSAS